MNYSLQYESGAKIKMVINNNNDLMFTIPRDDAKYINNKIHYPEYHSNFYGKNVQILRNQNDVRVVYNGDDIVANMLFDDQSADIFGKDLWRLCFTEQNYIERNFAD